ncbi:MAG: hypothetical protein IJX65_02965 [Alistipes sp.]|nr:hypothetical protein [Alistipes sp.]
MLGDTLSAAWGVILWAACFEVICRFFQRRFGRPERYGRRNLPIGIFKKRWSKWEIFIEVLKYIGIIGLLVAMLFIELVVAFVCPPVSILLTVVWAMIALYKLLENERWWYWVLTAVIIISAGIYYYFNIELPDPLYWHIADRPFDVPKQWLRNYPLFKTASIINITFGDGGLVAILLLILIKLFRRCRRKLLIRLRA